MFRFLELDLHGWDFWQPLRVPLDAGVVVLSGPNGAGKTTMLDAIRQVLHAPRLSQNRRISHYMRRPNEPALIRAVVSNRADQRGKRPFERQKVLTDEATLACALVPNGGSPEKRFLVLPGRVSPRDLQQRLLESRDWFSPEQYRRILENAGVSRSLMHILALEQGRADELSRRNPRELFGWIMEARGSQQVLDRYTGARRQYEDSMREVDRQNAQALRCQADLGELDRKVRRLEEYLEKKARLKSAEEIKNSGFASGVSGGASRHRKETAGVAHQIRESGNHSRSIATRCRDSGSLAGKSSRRSQNANGIGAASPQKL